MNMFDLKIISGKEYLEKGQFIEKDKFTIDDIKTHEKEWRQIQVKIRDQKKKSKEEVLEFIKSPYFGVSLNHAVLERPSWPHETKDVIIRFEGKLIYFEGGMRLYLADGQHSFLYEHRHFLFRELKKYLKNFHWKVERFGHDSTYVTEGHTSIRFKLTPLRN